MSLAQPLAGRKDPFGVGHVGQELTAIEVARPLEGGPCSRQVVAAQRRLPRLGGLRELVEVHAAAGGQEPVALRLGDEVAGVAPARQIGLEPAAQLEDDALQVVGRGGRLETGPEDVHQPFGRDEAVALEQQERQQLPAPLSRARSRQVARRTRRSALLPLGWTRRSLWVDT